MGINKAEEPKVSKVLVWPALMVTASTYASQVASFPQDGAQTSFHPFIKGLQHALCPDRPFNPLPLSTAALSHLFSPTVAGHCREFVFARASLHASTSLRPFTPRALPRFLASMGALTPARQAHSLPCAGQVSLVHMTRPSMHSVTNHLTRPIIASPLPAQRDGLPESLSFRSGLRHRLASSPLRPAESCSLSYGLHVRLQLLPTPPHGDAVTFSYQERASPGKGLSPLRPRLLTGALAAIFRLRRGNQQNDSANTP